jgi:hypothetical protein
LDRERALAEGEPPVDASRPATRPRRESLDVAPAFLGPTGVLTPDFLEAATEIAVPLDLDTVAIGSMLSFQYLIDGHSLVSQVKRRSWLEAVTGRSDGTSLTALAGYGRRLMTKHAAATELLARLRLELLEAFADAERVTLLLSGGLDSRLASAVLVALARGGHVTDQIRAVTWGMAGSRDRHYGQRVARHLGVEWIPIELGPSDLERNIRIAAHELAALVSPVHLHALDAVRQLDWHAGDRILASTLGNGIGRGQYLYRHVSHARSMEPHDWLGLMRPDLFARVRSQLLEELAAFRRRLRVHAAVPVHECEMLAHYISGLLLPALDLLRRTAAPVHQALSDARTYGFLWSLSPLVRTGSMYRTALRLCDPGLAEIPDARTNRPPRPLGRPERNGLSPFVHRYPRWIAHDLAEIIDGSLSKAWFDDTGIFDGSAIRRAWERIRSSSQPHPQTAYILIWLCTLRCLVEESAPRRRDGGSGPAGYTRSLAQRAPWMRQRPPWGFAGRSPEPVWQRMGSMPRQLLNALQCR